jgi:hypothetical protein
MATQVGSLYTSLTLESASFIANTKRAADATEKMAARVDRASSLAAGAVKGFIAAVSVNELAGLAKTALDYADAIADLSDRTGVSTRILQEFRFAAQLSGSSVEDADAAIAKFARTLGRAQQGSAAQVDLFERLGVQFRNANGSYRSLDEVLKSFSGQVSKLPTVQQRNAVTLEAMGKSAGSLTALLGQGAAGFDALAKEASELGIVMDEDLLRAAGPVNDQLDRMKQILDVQFSSAVARNAKSVLAFADAVGSLAINLGNGLRQLTDFVQRADRIKARLQSGDLVGAGRDILNFGLDSDLNSLDRKFPLPGAGRPAFTAAGDEIGGVAAMPGGTSAPRSGSRASAAAAPGLTPAQQRLFANDLQSPSLADTVAGLGGPLVDLDALGNTLNTDIKPALVDISNSFVELNQQSGKFADDLSRGLGQAIVFGQNLGDALINSIQAAAAELVSSALFDLLTGAIGGSGGIGGFVSSLFGGGRARGGAVSPNKVYRVGEEGEELFVPNSSGSIIPNNVLRSMGGAGGPVINVDARGATDPGQIEAAARRGAQQGIATAAELFRQSRRGSIPRGLI